MTSELLLVCSRPGSRVLCIRHLRPSVLFFLVFFLWPILISKTSLILHYTISYQLPSDEIWNTRSILKLPTMVNQTLNLLFFHGDKRLVFLHTKCLILVDYVSGFLSLSNRTTSLVFRSPWHLNVPPFNLPTPDSTPTLYPSSD